MNTRVAGNGYLKLQLSNEELEQLKYCVGTVIKKFDRFDEAGLTFTKVELEQFAKRVRTTTQPNPDGPGVEFYMNNRDLSFFLGCTAEVSRIYPQLDQESNKPTVQQLDRLSEQLAKIIDQIVG
ncbi:MAG: hypothetical protein P4L53_23090 [Candidatus Obscuribacterales bacterium]|nr:hypothetical protein [Candidatus Obscuribacterales bacterium]